MGPDLGSRLREARDELSTWYDRLNTQWKEAEEVVRGMGVSRPVWVAFRTASDESPGGRWYRDFEHCLACVKVKGEWRLCYSLGEVGDPDSHSPKPVLECSLAERKLALQGLPLLLSRIVEETVAEAAEIEVALGAAAKSLSPFKSGGGPIRKLELVDSMTVRDVLRMLEADGWYLVVTRGSHRQFKHPVKPGRVTVAGKPSHDVPPGTLNSILKQSGLDR